MIFFSFTIFENYALYIALSKRRYVSRIEVMRSPDGSTSRKSTKGFSYLNLRNLKFVNNVEKKSPYLLFTLKWLRFNTGMLKS